MPMGMCDQTPDKEWIFEFLKEPQNIEKYLSDFIDQAPKKIYTQVKFQYFSAAFLSSLSGAPLSTAEQTGLVVFSATGSHIVVE